MEYTGDTARALVLCGDCDCLCRQANRAVLSQGVVSPQVHWAVPVRSLQLDPRAETAPKWLEQSP